MSEKDLAIYTVAAMLAGGAMVCFVVAFAGWLRELRIRLRRRRQRGGEITLQSYIKALRSER